MYPHRNPRAPLLVSPRTDPASDEHRACLDLDMRSPAAGTRGAPPAPSPRAGGAGMFSLPGTFLHTAKINRGLLMELLFLTSVAQKCQSYRTAPQRGARSQQPRGRGAPASGSPGQELGGGFQPHPGERDPAAEGLRALAGDADPAQPPEKGFQASQRTPRTFLCSQALARSRKSQHLHHS